MKKFIAHFLIWSSLIINILLAINAFRHWPWIGENAPFVLPFVIPLTPLINIAFMVDVGFKISFVLGWVCWQLACAWALFKGWLDDA